MSAQGDSDGQDSYGTDDEDDLEEEGIHAEGSCSCLKNLR